MAATYFQSQWVGSLLFFIEHLVSFGCFHDTANVKKCKDVKKKHGFL
nr:MAG TPA: hypothetical protein [Caudoviricetes sp.]